MLLSRPILLSLGFNLEKHLARVRKDFHDTDFSHVLFDLDFGIGTNTPPPKAKLARLVRGDADEECVVDFLDDSDDEKAPDGFSSETWTAHGTTSTQISTLESEVEADIHSDPEVTPHLQLMLEE